MGAATKTIEEVFTKELWGEFLTKRVAKVKEMRDEASRLKLEESRIKVDKKNDSAKAVSKEASDLNV
eukprot:13290613-Ditylum_brightwellii.AAC.1